MIAELSQVDEAIPILINLLENLLHDLLPVLFVNATLGEEVTHLILVDAAVPVTIELIEFAAQPLLLRLRHLEKN